MSDEPILTVEEQKQLAGLLLKLQKAGLVRWSLSEVEEPTATIVLEAIEVIDEDDEDEEPCLRIHSSKDEEGKVTGYAFPIEGNPAAQEFYTVALNAAWLSRGRAPTDTGG